MQQPIAEKLFSRRVQAWTPCHNLLLHASISATFYIATIYIMYTHNFSMQSTSAVLAAQE